MHKITVIGLMLLAALFFVWPIPHTISIRDLLLLSVFILFGYLAYRQGSLSRIKEVKLPGSLYLILSAWILVGALTIADAPITALNEIRSQWLKGFMALLSGAWVGIVIGGEEKRVARLLTALAGILAVHVLFIDYTALTQIVERGSMSQRVEAFGGPDKSNYLTNTLLVFLFAEIYLRLIHGRRMLLFSNALLVLFLVAALFSVLATGVRNGIIEFTLILLLLLTLFIAQNRRHVTRTMLLSGVAVLVLAQMALGYLSYLSDHRWKTFIETVPIAWDTDSHKGWLNEPKYGLPKLSDGRRVDPSAYLRIAAIKAGAHLVIDNPLGIGYSRDAYGRGLEHKYGERSLGHSHSGLIDLAIGTGVPGASLWLVFLTSLLVMGWKNFSKTQDYFSLLLMLIVVSYSARMLVDSVIRDHMLQQFMLLIGLLAFITVMRQKHLPSRP